MRAIIIAGVLGTRLRPLTYKIPKPLAKINGKTLVEHTFDILKKFNIRHVTLSLSYMAEKIRKYFGDGSNLGMNINYVIEKNQWGLLAH